ncbi:MAG: acyl-CoA desaturase [Pseudomonadota bacterium]
MYHNARILEKKEDDAVEGCVEISFQKTLWICFVFLISIVGGWLTLSWSALLVFVITTSISLCFGHSLGMHRRLIHKSYECPKWMEYLFVHLGVIVGLAGPFGMIQTHDLRDWAQRQNACHSYFGHKQMMVIDFFWQLFCDIKLCNPPSINIEPVIANNKVYQWMEKTWMLQQVPLALLLFMLGGISWVIWGVFVRITVSVFGHWFIGYHAHNKGHQDWVVDGASVQGHNVRFAALLTMGESYHNNHHAFPGSANLALKDGQIDIGYIVLKGLSRMGLVWNIVLPHHLTVRPELQAAANKKVEQPN